MKILICMGGTAGGWEDRVSKSPREGWGRAPVGFWWGSAIVRAGGDRPPRVFKAGHDLQEATASLQAPGVTRETASVEA